MIGREHDTKRRDHAVEFSVAERKCLSITEPVFDGEILLKCDLACRIKKRPVDIHTNDLPAKARDRARRPARTGRDIRDAFARYRIQPVDTVLDCTSDAAADPIICPASAAPKRGRLRLCSLIIVFMAHLPIDGLGYPPPAIPGLIGIPQVLP